MTEEEEPKDFERMVVTGKKPSEMGGGLLSVIWRVTGLDGLFGQRSASKKAVPAPNLPSQELDQVTCSDPVYLRQNSATKVAGLYGLKPSPAQTGRQFRIKWRTGTSETYVNFGMSGGSNWMKVVADTCNDAS